MNVRLSPEQIFYTLNHAKPTTFFINEEFLPLYDFIKADLKSVERVVLLTDKTGVGALAQRRRRRIRKLIGEAEHVVRFSRF